MYVDYRRYCDRTTNVGRNGIICQFPRIKRLTILKIAGPQIGISRPILLDVSSHYCTYVATFYSCYPSLQRSLQQRDATDKKGKNETYRCGIILLGAYYGVSSPNMAALLFNVRLMGSSWYRISLVATYRVVLYGLV